MAKFDCQVQEPDRGKLEGCGALFSCMIDGQVLHPFSTEVEMNEFRLGSRSSQAVVAVQFSHSSGRRVISIFLFQHMSHRLLKPCCQTIVPVRFFAIFSL